MGDSEVIAARRDAFLAAFNRQDIEAMSELLTDDMVAIPPNRPELVGLEASQAFWREGFAAVNSVFGLTPIRLQVAGDLAVDRFAWTMDTTPHEGGDTMRDKGGCVWAWRREGGTWKLSWAIWNSDLPEPGFWAGA